jgi:hypothetical protein
MDCKRREKMSNDVWENPNDAETEITRLKDGRTALACKAENAQEGVAPGGCVQSGVAPAFPLSNGQAQSGA